MAAASTADGSVVLSVDMNVSDAERSLAKLSAKVQKLEQDLARKDSDRIGIGKQMVEAGAEVDGTIHKIEQLKAELESVRNITTIQNGTFGDVSPEKYLNALAREKELSQELAEQEKLLASQNKTMDSLESKYASAEKNVEGIKNEIVAVKTAAGDLQQQIESAEQARIEASSNAEIADQRIVDLNAELLQLKQEQKALEQIGLGPGYEQYDQNTARIAEINRELKEYQKNLTETEQPAAGAAQASGLMASILSRMGQALQSAGDTAGKAFKAIGRAARSAIKNVSAVSGQVVKFGKEINVLSKLSDVVGKKLKRLAGMFRRVFVFSVITKGLREIRSQMAKYLSINAEFTTATRRLKGVLLTAFQPVYEAVLPALTAFINTISRAIAAVSQFFAALFGTTAKQAQENAKALYEQANATEAAGNAAEEASGQLAAFDEINKLEDNNSSSGSGAAADTGPLFDWEYDDTPFETWGEAFSAFLEKLLDNIPKLESALDGFADGLNDWSQKVYDMFSFPGVLDKVKQLGSDLSAAFNDMVQRINWEQLGRALGAGLLLALGFLTSLLYTFDWIALGGKLAEFINGLAGEVDWYAFGQLLWAGFKIAIETLAGFILGLNMPELAKAASQLIIGFFDSMRETIEGIDWRRIGEQIRTFLVNVDWESIAKSVFGAIKAAFNASSDFFSGLLGDELKRTLVDLLILLGEYAVVIGAILTLSGVNIQMGLGLMAAGAGLLGTAAVMDWQYVLGQVEKIATDILVALGAALLAIGAILVFSKANLMLGVGLMAAGAVSLATALAINWNFLPNTIKGIVTKITLILGVAFLAIGAILTFTHANLPLGIGLMALGAASLATALAINWDTIVTALQGTIGNVEAILSVAFLALGAVLLFTGAGIPLGLGLIAIGAVGLAAYIAANWNTIQPKISGVLTAIKIVAEAAKLVLGVVLLFTGAGIPLGLGLIASGAYGLVSTIKENWNYLPDKVKEAFNGLKTWWEQNAAKYFTLDYWKNKGKEMVDGFLKGLKDIWDGLMEWVRDVKDAISDAFSGADTRPRSSVYGSSTNRGGFGSGARTYSMPSITDFHIPALARGAVIPPNREFLAVLGDQRSGNNLEGPESMFRKIVQEESGGSTQLLKEILAAIKEGQVIMVDRRVLGKVVRDELNRRTRASGYSDVLT